ncbi:MAG: YecA family protein [Caldimonas sp.]
MTGAGRRDRRGAPAGGPTAPTAPLAEREIEALQALLDAIPAPLEPLDVVALDGYLCGVLVQPEPVPPARWLAHVVDAEGRPLPAGHDPAPLQALVRRRHAELADAIARRRWFDPWIFESGEVADDDPGEAVRRAVFPWVAGIATAFELFPAVMRLPAETTLEPLALLYRHLDADDLEEADALLAEIDTLEPVLELAEAVEGLVRATLLLADAAALAEPPAQRRRPRGA